MAKGFIWPVLKGAVLLHEEFTGSLRKQLISLWGKGC